MLSGTMLIMVVALVIRAASTYDPLLGGDPAADSDEYRGSGHLLGASKMKSFFKVTVPMMTAGIVSGAILSWVTMISELSTAIISYTGQTKTLTG